MKIRTTVTVKSTAGVWPLGASLLDMHRIDGHRSVWRCRVAVALYDLSRWVSSVADRVGCRN